MFQLSSALTPRLYTNPASTTNASLDPFEASEVHYSLRYIFLIDCIETRGVVGHFPPRLSKVGEKEGGHILLFMVNILLVTEFSALEKKC
jgi:hypothetical protein